MALSVNAHDERPLLAYGGQVRGRGISNARRVWPVRSCGKARSARPPCPSTSLCTCWKSWYKSWVGDVGSSLEPSRAACTNPIRDQ